MTADKEFVHFMKNRNDEEESPQEYEATQA